MYYKKVLIHVDSTRGNVADIQHIFDINKANDLSFFNLKKEETLNNLNSIGFCNPKVGLFYLFLSVSFNSLSF